MEFDTEIKQTKILTIWNVCLFKCKEHPSSLIQTTTANRHTKIFLINTWFYYVIATELTVVHFPLPYSFRF